MAARVSSQKTSWAGASAKVQIIFKKRKAFYNSPSAQAEIPLTTYKAVGIHAPTHQFKRKIDCGLGSRSDSVAVKAIPGQATVRKGKCPTAQPQPPPAPFSSPSKELDTSKDLLALRPQLFSHPLK